MRQRLREFFRDPRTELFIVFLIFISVGGIVAEEILPDDEQRTDAHDVIVLAGEIILVLFIIELSLRFYASANRRRFFGEYWIDILAVLPIFRAFRIARLFRLFRIFRLFRAGMIMGRRFSLFSSVWRRGGAEYLILCTIALALIFFGAMGILLMEKGAHGSEIHTLEEAFWWAIQSLIAGEPIGGVAHTTGGRIVTLLVMLGGMFLFALLTGVVASFMIEHLRARVESSQMILSDLREHVVLCGWNRSAAMVIEELQHGEDARKPILVIAEIEDFPDFEGRVRLESLHLLKEDFTKMDALEKGNVNRAAKVIILADDTRERTDQDRDARTILAALTVEKLQPGVYTCAELLNPDNAAHLAAAGIEEVVVPVEFSGRLLGSIAMHRGITKMFREIFIRGEGNDIHVVPLEEAWGGRAYRDLLLEMKEKHDAVPLAIIHASDGDGRSVSLVVNPPADTKLQKGSEVVCLCRSRPRI